MIWLLMGILVLAVLLFVTKPLYAKSAPQMVQDAEVADYLDEINRIDVQITDNTGEVELLQAAKTDLQRGLLASKGRPIAEDAGPPPLLLASLFVVFGFAAIGIYAMLGRPELTIAGALQAPTLAPAQALSQNENQNGEPQHENNMSLDQLIVQLEEKLKGDGNTADGWILYARTLMNLGRYAEALVAYDKVVALSESNPNVVSEREQARAFIAQRRSGTTSAQPGPNADDVKAAADMSAQDRQAMIEGMVAGLSQKLIENPKNPEGWVRLLRARGVLGQTEQGSAEIERMRDVFKDEPAIIDQILSASGWGKVE